LVRRAQGGGHRLRRISRREPRGSRAGNRRDGENRVSGSAIISFRCATQPTVRATAKTGVNIVGEDDALQFHRQLEERIVALPQASSTS
jgi:hypothetical protein